MRVPIGPRPPAEAASSGTPAGRAQDDILIERSTGARMTPDSANPMVPDTTAGHVLPRSGPCSTVGFPPTARKSGERGSAQSSMDPTHPEPDGRDRTRPGERSERLPPDTAAPGRATARRRQPAARRRAAAGLGGALGENQGSKERLSPKTCDAQTRPAATKLKGTFSGSPGDPISPARSQAYPTDRRDRSGTHRGEALKAA